jgi:hypothetical protein
MSCDLTRFLENSKKEEVVMLKNLTRFSTFQVKSIKEKRGWFSVGGFGMETSN